MNRSVRVISSLVLIGLLAMGAVGMGLCICANGHVALEMGCDGECRSSERAPDCGQHSGDEAHTAACGDGGGCVYVPLSPETTLHSSSERANLSLSTKSSLLGTHPADCLNSRANDGVRADASRALRMAMRTSASVLAQRTIVLRI